MPNTCSNALGEKASIAIFFRNAYQMAFPLGIGALLSKVLKILTCYLLLGAFFISIGKILLSTRDSFYQRAFALWMGISS